MKKVFLSILMVALGFTANAQEGFNIGANIGIPTGDADGFDITYAIEANYLFEVSDALQVGPSVSYLVYSSDFIDLSFLPVAAAARYALSEKFIVGLDLGYGLSLEEYIDDGFYYRPMVGFKVSDLIMLQAFYSGIELDGATVASFGAGIMFDL